MVIQCIQFQHKGRYQKMNDIFSQKMIKGVSEKHRQAIQKTANINAEGESIIFDKKNQTFNIFMYGTISRWDFDTTDVSKQLRKNQNDISTINIYTNSGGGSVYDAWGLYTTLSDIKQKQGVTINNTIEGIAASAATFYIGVSDSISIGESAEIMIHEAWGIFMGNKNELKENISRLEKIDNNISKVYAKKTGKTEQEIQEKMKQETWFSADDALKYGLVDKIIESQYNDEQVQQEMDNMVTQMLQDIDTLTMAT